MQNKIYRLNPNTWGSQFFVLASSKEEALKFIIKSKEYDTEQFKNSTPDNLPMEYTLDEYTIGQVISSEVA